MFVRDFARAISVPPLSAISTTPTPRRFLDVVAILRTTASTAGAPVLRSLMASPFTVGPLRYLSADPPETPRAPRAPQGPGGRVHVRSHALPLDHLDDWDRPVFVERTARGRARTQAASAARWRDYDAAARTHFLRWVVSQRWQKASPTARCAVVAQLNAAKRTRVAMLPSVLPVLVVVTNRGEVAAEQARPEVDLVCQTCGAADALPWRPLPLRTRVGVYYCRRHARALRTLYAGTGGMSFALLR